MDYIDNQWVRQAMKLPTAENLYAAKQIRDEMWHWKYVDGLLDREISRLGRNTDPGQVAYKSTLIDSLYVCNLKVDARYVAGKIVELDIDNKLDLDDPVGLVKEISRLELPPGRKRKTFGPVFASKYCHFHRPKRFAIFDKFAKHALRDLLGRKIRNYCEFKSGVDKLIEELVKDINYKKILELVGDIDYKKIDEYLWIYGQWLYLRNGRNREVSSNFKNLASSLPRKLFAKLEPPMS